MAAWGCKSSSFWSNPVLSCLPGVGYVIPYFTSQDRLKASQADKPSLPASPGAASSRIKRERERGIRNSMLVFTPAFVRTPNWHYFKDDDPKMSEIFITRSKQAGGLSLCHQCVSSNFISTSLLMHQHQELPWASQSSRCMTFMKLHGFFVASPWAETAHTELLSLDLCGISSGKTTRQWSCDCQAQPFQPINGWTCHQPFSAKLTKSAMSWKKKQLMYIVISDCYTLPMTSSVSLRIWNSSDVQIRRLVTQIPLK